MKRSGNLFKQICSMENLKLAHKKARKNKSFYSEVRMVNSNEDYYLSSIRDSLLNLTWLKPRDSCFTDLATYYLHRLKFP
jgi:hypothetical protein